MREPVTIEPGQPLIKGMDYTYLKEEGTRLVQQLAGEIWTDYNESDPGVTTLEQLCYALTELSYRAEFPLKDLLIAGPPPHDRINPHRQALFIPRRIFPGNPLNRDDYRRLLLDQVPEVANVWLRCRRPKNARGIDGLYSIDLYIPPADPIDRESEPDEIRERVRQIYNRHRNLCEDIDARAIRVLKPFKTTVDARVTMAAEARTPETTLARILFRLGNLLAPEPRRVSLKRLLEQGRSPSEIFNGPLLRNGFIDADQLLPKSKKISVQELLKVLMRSPGVTSARDIVVHAHGKSYRGDQSVPVPNETIPHLKTTPGKNGYSIRLWQNGIEQQVDPVRVQRELSRLWSEHRRTYRLVEQYKQYFALPRGRYRDLRQYFSVQNQFPNLYGINEYGLPNDATAARQAQAKQFKGYLLVFDQLMANYFAQLANAKDLYNIDDAWGPTYFYQDLLESVPNIEPLLIDGADHYRRGLEQIVRRQDPMIERRNCFLEFLLAMYAEQLDALSVWGTAREPNANATRRLKARQALLQQLIRSTADRSRGFDYLSGRSRFNIAGMEIKSRIQLGMRPRGERTLSEFLRQHSLELVRSHSQQHKQTVSHDPGVEIEAKTYPLDDWADEGEPENKPKTASLPSFVPQAITEEQLMAASTTNNLRVGKLSEDGDISLICQLPAGGWWQVAEYPDDGRHHDAIRASVEHLHHHDRQLYIVEHILLRTGRRRGHDDRFVYNFTISAVISECPFDSERDNYRTFVHEVIRQNTPAHIAIDYCFLTPWLMCLFERRYVRWRYALRTGRDLRAASRRLREFLQHFSSRPS